MASIKINDSYLSNHQQQLKIKINDLENTQQLQALSEEELVLQALSEEELNRIIDGGLADEP